MNRSYSKNQSCYNLQFSWYFQQFIFFSRMCSRIGVISLIFCIFCLEGVLATTFRAQIDKNSVENLKITAQEALEKIDMQNRREFWAYLRRPQIIFSSYKATASKFSYFILYDSVVGVFLSICSFERETGNIEISALVRIGDLIAQSQEQYVVSLQPIVVGIRISQKFYEVDIDSTGKMEIDEQMFQIKEQMGSLADQRIKMTDNYIRHKYWVYLYGASIMESQVIKAGDQDCVLFLYDHKNGIYLTIAGLNKNYQLDVITFAKLGKKYITEDNQKKYQNSHYTLADLQPKIIDLK